MPIIEGSQDHFNKEINNASSSINKDTSSEWNKIYDELTTGQLARNRAIVKEIIDTIVYFKSEIADEVESMKGD